MNFAWLREKLLAGGMPPSEVAAHISAVEAGEQEPIFEPREKEEEEMTAGERAENDARNAAGDR